jgi:hypothetical protein
MDVLKMDTIRSTLIPVHRLLFYAALATLGFRNNVEFPTLHAHKRRLCRHSLGCDPVRQIPSSALALDPASFKQAKIAGASGSSIALTRPRSRKFCMSCRSR